jgi:hypothetical protein
MSSFFDSELANREVLSQATKRHISNVTCCRSPRDKVLRKCHIQCKRSKNNIEARKRVTFATHEGAIGLSPYNTGSKDVTENQIDYHNIWYTVCIHIVLSCLISIYSHFSSFRIC